MAVIRRAFPFGQFGGLRLDVPVDEVPATQAIDLLDVDWEGSSDGGLRRRDGATVFLASAGAAQAALWRHSDQALILLSRNGGVTAVQAYKPSASLIQSKVLLAEAESINFASLGTPSASYTYAAIYPFKISRFDGSVFANPEATVDGVAGKAMPVARYIAAWPAGGSRMVYANTTQTGGPGGAASSNSHIWISLAEGQAEAFESTSYVQFAAGDGEEITGVVTWGGQVFVTKRTKMIVLYGIRISEEGRPTFEYKEFPLPSPHFGGSSNGGQRVVAASDGVYMVCQDGVYVTTGGPVGKVSGALLALDVPRSIPGPAATTFGSIRWLDFAQLYYFRSRLYLVAPALTLVYDMQRGEWLPWTTAITSMAPWNQGSGGPDYLYFSSPAGIYKFDPAAASDPTVTMAPRWQSGFYDLGTQDEKTLVEDKLFGEGSVTLSGYADFSSTAAFSKSASLGASGVKQGRMRRSQTATYFSHKITLGTGGKVQRLIRYAREGRTPTTKTG
jgi:hypothetical protein